MVKGWVQKSLEGRIRQRIAAAGRLGRTVSGCNWGPFVEPKVGLSYIREPGEKGGGVERLGFSMLRCFALESWASLLPSLGLFICVRVGRGVGGRCLAVSEHNSEEETSTVTGSSVGTPMPVGLCSLPQGGCRD